MPAPYPLAALELDIAEINKTTKGQGFYFLVLEASPHTQVFLCLGPMNRTKLGTGTPRQCRDRINQYLAERYLQQHPPRQCRDWINQFLAERYLQQHPPKKAPGTHQTLVASLRIINDMWAELEYTPSGPVDQTTIYCTTPEGRYSLGSGNNRQCLGLVYLDLASRGLLEMLKVPKW